MGKGEASQIERARRVLLEGPHRRTQPEPADRGTSRGVRGELLISLKQREAILHVTQPLRNPPLEFLHGRLL
jgi:hypothetical protein